MNGRLEAFPVLHNVPGSLKYLNLFDNKITSLPADFKAYSNATVFLGVNPFVIDTAAPSNIVEYEQLEQKYNPPYYWSSATSFSGLD
jgi:hypothetical protein